MVSIAEVDALVGAMPAQWCIAVELAAWCHLRVGEVLGLERRDVDLLHGAVRVERTANDVNGRLYLGPPKTAAGKGSSPYRRTSSPSSSGIWRLM